MILMKAYMHDPFATDENPTTEGPIMYGLPFQFPWKPDPETYPDIVAGDEYVIPDPTYPDKTIRVRISGYRSSRGGAWLWGAQPGYHSWCHEMPLAELALLIPVHKVKRR